MKRITIDIYENENEDGVLRGFTEIKCKELHLMYSCTTTFQGMQSNYDGDDERYMDQVKLCSKIAALANSLIQIG